MLGQSKRALIFTSAPVVRFRFLRFRSVRFSPCLRSRERQVAWLSFLLFSLPAALLIARRDSLRFSRASSNYFRLDLAWLS